MMVAVSPGAQAIDAYKWKYRPLVVIADSEASPSLAAQRRIVSASRAGFIERNIVVVWVVGNRVTADFGPSPGVSGAALRARFAGRTAAFRSVLVGKDGGAKLSSASPLSASTLFGTIDAMPMRMQEMRRK
jgi:hypothetical protein